MENSLTCFEFKKSIPDFFDDTLSSSLKKTTQIHLVTCTSCQILLQHYQIIQITLKNHPRSSLPQELKEKPFSSVLPLFNAEILNSLHWEKSPWYIKILTQSGLIVFFVVTLISSTPKLRELYEVQIEKSFSELKDPLFARQEISLQDPQHLSESQTSPELSELSTNEDELNSEDDFHSTSQMNDSQLWRFTLKTVSPDELRLEVLRVLEKFNTAQKNLKALGIQVPGGIEFNFQFDTEQISKLKDELQRLAPSSTSPSHSNPGTESFTWYKVHSKKKLPDKKSQVIIWISQPH
jgi:hypothetical protein